MRREVRASIISGVIILGFIASAGHTQPRPDPERGHEVATRVCRACHAVDRDSSGKGEADIPSFAVIARQPWASTEYVAARIQHPHPKMPGLPLNAQEVRDVATYIMTLKRPD